MRTSALASARSRPRPRASGISARTLDVAFSGLEPDPKVLDLQHQQPEFKTPVWDYVDGLVDDDRVADGKAAMARESRALARAEETIWRSPHHAGGDLGGRVEFRPGDGQALARPVADDARLHGRSRQLFPLRTDGDAENHRPRRRAGREAQRVMGGRVRADAVHALDLHAPRGRRRRRRAARHRRFRFGRARFDRELFCPIGLAPRHGLGLRGQAAGKLFGPVGAQGQTIHGVLGRARGDPHRRAPAGRRAKPGS